MAKSNLTPQEFIQNSFAPQIAILCSEDADNICLKNNLRFVELLQPFSKTNSETRIADPSGSIITIKNFKVFFEDMNRRPPQPTLGKKILSDAVSNTSWDEEESKSVKSWTGGTNLNLNLQSSTPWFEDWRDIFLQIQYPSDHEFTKHYIACIIVISAGSENPMDQLNRLSQYQHQQQHQNPTRFPKWFSPNIMKYYVLLHDNEEVESTKADQVFEQMTSAYGTTNCHMLHLNSRPLNQSDVNMPDPWHRLLQHRGLVEGNSVGASGSSETSSGTGTPREDLVGLPTRVTEGDSSEPSDTIQHPLSPVAPPPEEKNGMVEAPPEDVPLLLNRQSLPFGTSPPLHHGACLTPSDVDRIQIFVDEFVLRALIPHVEKQIRHLNDVVTNRSRSKSLLSATRRWLGGTKPPTSGTNSVIYSQEATELQTRRLGDLCFMFGLYDLSYNAYYTAKNDFKSDQAWLYFAGAQEMAALSSFMQNQSEFPKRYSEGSLHTYLNVCKVYNFAIRLTLLSTEVLKLCGEFGEAAMMFIKMTSEESDLLSALMLEQAAHCFINSKRPLLRKYAFHMTLAGHRFSKAGQRAHSLRAYKQAFQVYLDRGWILAEDHIHYTMGKQAFLLKLNQESLEATTRLIDQGTKKDAPTQQSDTQQLAYMREFLNILDKCLKEEGGSKPPRELVSLPVPILIGQRTQVLIGDPLEKSDETGWCNASHVSFADEEFREKRWFALEREVLVAVHGPSMTFRPNFQRLSDSTPNTHSPTVPLKERVSLQIYLKNPLLISLTLSSVRPVYSFFDESGTLVQDESCVLCDSVSGFNMPPESEEVITLNIWPQRVGRVAVSGIAYKISLTPDLIGASDASKRISVEVHQNIELKGPRLNANLQEKTSVVHAKDERVNLEVVPSMPRLCVRLRDPPAILSCGELQHVETRITNVGPVPLKSIYVAVSEPRNILFTLDHDGDQSILETKLNYVEGSREYGCVTRVQKISLPGDSLQPGQSLTGHLWLNAPQEPGSFDVELLFYYEPLEPSSKKRYRLLRHLSSIYLYPSISLQVQNCRSVGLLPESSSPSPHRHSCHLVFHVKNKCEIDSGGGSVELVGVSANSSFYGMLPFNLKGSTRVDVKESCQLCVQCAHVQDSSSNRLVFTSIPAKPNISVPACWWQFTLRERLKLPELTADPPPPNPSANYDSPPPTKDMIISRKLKDSLELDLVATILWKSWRGEEEIVGLHCLYLDQLEEECQQEDLTRGLLAVDDGAPVRIIPIVDTDQDLAPHLAPLFTQRHLVKVSLHVPNQISHNFKKEALCRVNFNATFYNSSACAHTAEVDFSSKSMTKAEGVGGGGQTQMFSPEASLNLLSVGASTRLFTLDPFESKTLSVHSVVTAPGTYSLGAFSLRVKREGSTEWVSQVCHQQSAVLVRSEAPSAMDRHMASELASIQALSSSHS